MLSIILKENRYLFPFLIHKNYINKYGKSTFNKEILFNSFDNLFEKKIEIHRRKIFNKELLYNNIIKGDLNSLNNLEYLAGVILENVYSNNTYFVHSSIKDNINFLHQNNILSFNDISFNVNKNLLSVSNEYKPFYIFNTLSTNFIFIQSGLTTLEQTDIYNYLKTLNISKIHFIPYNFANKWSQTLFDYVIFNENLNVEIFDDYITQSPLTKNSKINSLF